MIPLLPRDGYYTAKLRKIMILRHKTLKILYVPFSCFTRIAERFVRAVHVKAKHNSVSIR